MTLASLITFLVGGALGLLIGKRKVRASERRPTEIKLKWESGAQKFTAKTRDQKLKAHWGDFVSWDVKEDHAMALPANAAVEIRFDDDNSPLHTKRPRDRKDVGSLVTGHEGLYHYQVWYVAPEAQYCMEDPDLEILP